MLRLRAAHWWMRTRTYRNIGGDFVGLPIESIAGIGGAVIYGIAQGLLLAGISYMFYAIIGWYVKRTHIYEYKVEFEATLNPILMGIHRNSKRASRYYADSRRQSRKVSAPVRQQQGQEACR